MYISYFSNFSMIILIGFNELTYLLATTTATATATATATTTTTTTTTQML
jgi:hypothetical protein